MPIHKTSVFSGGPQRNSFFSTFLTLTHIPGSLGIKIRNCLFFKNYFQRIAIVLEAATDCEHPLVSACMTRISKCMIFIFLFSKKTRMHLWSWMPRSSCMHTWKMSKPLLHHYLWSQCWMQGNQTSSNLLLQTRLWGRSLPYLWRT